MLSDQLKIIAAGVAVLAIGMFPLVGGLPGGAFIVFSAALAVPALLIWAAVRRDDQPKTPGGSQPLQKRIESGLPPIRLPNEHLARAEAEAEAAEGEAATLDDVTILIKSSSADWPSDSASEHLLTPARAVSASRNSRDVAPLVNVAGMDTRDFEDAWKLISGWRDQADRGSKLDLCRTSHRRPYVVIGLIRIASMLSSAAGVGHLLSEQLSANAYDFIEEGILNVTDHIMSGLGDEELATTEGILPTLIDQERRARAARQ